MVVDVWSDVVCPFCYLGAAQLRAALERFEHGADVVVRWRAYELDPATPLALDRPLVELVAAKYGQSVEVVERFHRRLEAEGAALGVEMDLSRARPTNTFDAHRVIALARTQGLEAAMADRLFAAYFARGELVSDHATLARLAGEVGVAGALEALGTGAFADDVREDEAIAREAGLTGVPAFAVDGRLAVMGAQGVDALGAALERSWARRAGTGRDEVSRAG